MNNCLDWKSEELKLLAIDIGVESTPAFADKVGTLIEKLGLNNNELSDEEVDKINEDIDKLNNRIISLKNQLNLYDVDSEQYNSINSDLNKSKSELSTLESKLNQVNLPTLTQLKEYLNTNKSTAEKTKTAGLKGLSHAEIMLPAWTKKFFIDEFKDEKTGDVDFDKVNELLPEVMDMIGYRIPTEDKYSMLPLKVVGFLPSGEGGGIMLPAEITTISGSDKKRHCLTHYNKKHCVNC